MRDDERRVVVLFRCAQDLRNAALRAVDELLERLTFRRIVQPVELCRAGADQAAKEPLAQLRLESDGLARSFGNDLTGLLRTPHVAAEDLAKRHRTQLFASG